MKKVLMVNGPNINLLGAREKNVYGSTGYGELVKKAGRAAKKCGLELEAFQSNHEGEIIDRIQSARGDADLIIINPGGYTHTSVSIRDALLAVQLPFIEVHISNVYQREDFRKKSLLSDVAAGIIAGFGINSYFIAIEAARMILAGGGNARKKRAV